VPRLAPLFVDFAGVTNGQHVLDVGLLYTYIAAVAHGRKWHMAGIFVAASLIDRS